MKQNNQTEKLVAVRVRQEKMAGDNRLFFLFTAGQVEEVLPEITVQPVPFAPSFLQGIASWRGRLLPVIDLEQCLGMDAVGRGGKERYLIIRTGAPGNRAGERLLRCILQVSEEIRPMDVSDDMSHTNASGVDQSLLKGAYQWKEDSYIIPDLLSILQTQQSAVACQ
ncbi:MAG: chemotaxis protein CheW [Thermodesulfobacteriota bacterium]